MNDETFQSKLELLLDEYEIGIMSNTSSKIIVEMIMGLIGLHNLAMMHRDKEDGRYADKRYNGIVESQQRDIERLDI